MKTSNLKKSTESILGKFNSILTACSTLFFFIVVAPGSPASAQAVLFNFDNAPIYTSLPIDQTVSGITAHLSATGQGYSIQDANVLGFTPPGFAGHIIYPNSIYLADLLISYDQTLTDFSIMYSCQELGCDDAATMRVTAYMNGSFVGTNTKTASHPGTWPVETLSCSFSQGFNSVVVHYDSPPPTCQDYGVIYLADNMRVTVLTCAQPPADITAGGSTTFCSGGSVTLNAPVNASYTYQWIKNGVNISGATSSVYTATTGGNYKVTVTNITTGCSKTTATPTIVIVNSLPSATITSSGTTTFCTGGSVVLTAVVNTNYSYQWKKGAAIIPGATLSSYTATTGGNYRVIVTNIVTGCSKTTGTAALVTVNALPAATITPQGPTTFCAGGSVILQANTGTGLTYRWKKGNGIIGGATLSNYTATTAGTYKTEVTNSNGCSKNSTGVVVTVPCREEEKLISSTDFKVSIFPNPAHSEINIVISSDDDFEIKIVNAFGEIIIQERNQNKVDISKLVSGFYFIKVLQGNNLVTQKFIKE